MRQKVDKIMPAMLAKGWSPKRARKVDKTMPTKLAKGGAPNAGAIWERFGRPTSQPEQFHQTWYLRFGSIFKRCSAPF